MAPSYLEEELLKRRVQSCNNQSCSQQARLSFIHSLPRYMHAVSRTRSASGLRARLPRLKKEGRTKLDLALNRRPASERVGVMKAQSAATLDTVLNGVVATNYLSPVRVIEDLVAQERESDAVILLNNLVPPESLSLWMSCAYRVCADGGANQVEALQSQYAEAVSRMKYDGHHAFKHPNCIVGDMDSVSTTVVEMYRDNSEYDCTFVNQQEDQDSTDFVKCLKHIIRCKPGIKRVFALGGLGGRLDHVLYNIKTLFDFSQLEIVLIGDNCIARAIPVGRTVIKRDGTCSTTYCGLVPLQGTARVKTTGLKWNLNDDVMAFSAGGLISTSNQFVSDEVTVETDEPLLFTSSPS